MSDESQSAKMQKAKILLMFLPVGFLSNPMWQFITRNDSNIQLTCFKYGHIEKRRILVKYGKHRSRKRIYYALTPKGLEYIKSQCSDIEWISDLEIPKIFNSRSEFGNVWVERFIRQQDNIAFFSLCNIKTIQTEILNCTPYGLMFLYGFSNTLKCPHKNSLADIIIKAQLKYLSDHNFNPDFLNCYIKTYNDPDENANYFPAEFTITHNPSNYYYGSISEASFTSELTKNPIQGTANKGMEKFRDNAVGVLCTKNQYYSVYYSQINGMWSSNVGFKEGLHYNQLCASYVFPISTMGEDRKCHNAIMICRNKREAVKTIADPMYYRSANDRAPFQKHNHVFLIVLSDYGLEEIEQIKDRDPKQYELVCEAQKKDFAKHNKDVVYNNDTHALYTVKTKQMCYLNLDMDIKVLLAAMKYSEDANVPVEMYCEKGQEEIYSDIIEAWKRNPLFVVNPKEERKENNQDIILKVIKFH